MTDPTIPSVGQSGRPGRLLFVAVAALFVHQTLVAMSRLALPVLTPLVSEDLGISPALIGAYSGILSLSATVLALGAGGLIERHGAWRMCQITLITTSIAFFVAIPGTLLLFAAMAVLVGPGPGVATPASSQVLARCCPPKQAPFYFSIKQTGVPAGGLLAGTLVPFLALRFGWQGSFLAIGILYVGLAFLLQPFRAEFDDDLRRQSRHSWVADARSTLKRVTADSRLREMVLAAFAFVGLQAAFDSFFVTFLVKGLGYSLTAAGTLFAAAQGVSICARILWGWIAGRFLPARKVLAWLGMMMAVATATMGLAAPEWSVAAVAAVAMVYAATAFSWNGVLLAEVARLAPADKVGATTGGIIVFIMGAATLYPVVFAAILATTGSYGWGYMAAAVPALLVGAHLHRRVDNNLRG
jgi:MFS family permease